MRPLSAIDAIAPAWNHARRLSLAPRSWRLALKIGTVAFFARMGGCSGNIQTPGQHTHSLPPAFAAALIGMFVVIAIIAFVLALVFFYLGSRLQFVLFDVVLRSDTTIAPIWRRYGRATWHWIGLKLAFFAVALVCVSPILVPMVIHFIRSMPAHGATPNFAAFFMSILGFIAAIFLVLLLIGIGYTLLSDFGLPSMALESTPMEITVRRAWSLLRYEPGQVLLYLVMKFLLGLAGTIASYIALFFGALIALIPLGGAALVAWLSLRHAGLAGHVAMIAAWIILGLVLAVLLIIAAIMLLGFVFTFLQAYALYFLGGRYPLVGQYLEPFVPPLYAYSGVAPAYAPPAQPERPLPAEGEP